MFNTKSVKKRCSFEWHARATVANNNINNSSNEKKKRWNSGGQKSFIWYWFLPRNLYKFAFFENFKYKYLKKHWNLLWKIHFQHVNRCLICKIPWGLLQTRITFPSLPVELMQNHIQQKTHYFSYTHITHAFSSVRVRSCKTFHQLSVYFSLFLPQHFFFRVLFLFSGRRANVRSFNGDISWKKKNVSRWLVFVRATDSKFASHFRCVVYKTNYDYDQFRSMVKKSEKKNWNFMAHYRSAMLCR